MTQLIETSPVQAVNDWLARFTEALEARDATKLKAVFRQDAYWRDLIAFTGHIRSFAGRDELTEQLVALADGVRPHGFTLATDLSAPSVQIRGGEEVTEAFIEFHTKDVTGRGVIRLVAADDELGVTAVSLMTAAQEFKGFEEPVGERRREHAVPHRFSGPNWREHMDALTAFDGREPEVVIVGAGQGGLCVAAGLRLMGVDVLLVEKNDRVGDNWRNRYHSLVLHNRLSVNKLPYMPFPATWPEYLPKDKFGGWLESYAENMELPVWTKTTFIGGDRDAASGTWSLRVDQDGNSRTLHPRHVVIATGGGICARPNKPHVNGIEQFRGQVLHSSEVSGIEQFKGKHVLIFGTGTSAHDLAAQLVENGGSATMVQRNPTNVVSQPTANLYLQIFEERAAEEVDLIFNANSYDVTKTDFIAMTKIAADLDHDLIQRLESAGFRTDNGIDDAGYFWNFLERGGGYYIDVGSSGMIIEGRIGLIQFADIDTFTESGVSMRDGTQVAADAAIFATGYGNQSAQVRELFGDQIADEVGPIWGFGDDLEIRNTWRPTPVDGLWFVGGGIPHARNYGRYVALQIKGRLDGAIAGTDVNAASMWVK
ncbi:FAD-dependent pyridine nucleotide-disulfide oxidoreductase [Mycolicibacterium rhodesiae JS60]|nr:FAD-dependent pyridine nucleotide-disulfide oxidoreductase [Mycolicibacterium rhodesiae JS60]